MRVGFEDPERLDVTRDAPGRSARSISSTGCSRCRSRGSKWLVKIAADRDTCIGAGLCVVTAPEMFDQDDDGLVVLLVEQPADDAAAAAAREAVSLCPSAALRLIEG